MSTTELMTTGDGTKVLLRSWAPAGPPRAAVVVLHGLGEHSGRYEHVGAHLAMSGLAPFAVDLRGFGGSEGRRAFVKDFAEYYGDVRVATDRAAELAVPVVLLGHSMGGLVALRFRQEQQGADFLVLSSPSLDAEIPTAKRVAARVLRRILPALAIPNDITADQLSRDPSVGEAYFSDPLVEIKTTAALGGALLEAMTAARSGAIPVPTLVIHGECDTLVPASISEPLAAHAGVDRIVFPGFHHESFNEEGGAAALAAVTEWIDTRLAQMDS